ncbi:hypothetical protein B0H19DRAFT_1383138 [Mycena capillaripes]|nr:hypothetical protein B0H19DRAFT_1383138 [Mycena capillaripes]
MQPTAKNSPTLLQAVACIWNTRAGLNTSCHITGWQLGHGGRGAMHLDIPTLRPGSTPDLIKSDSCMTRGLRHSPYYLHHRWQYIAFNSWSGWKSIANASRVVGDHANWGAQAAADGARRGAQAVQDTTSPAMREKLGQAAVAMNEAAEFVGGRAQRGAQAAVVGVRRSAQFAEDATPPVVKEKYSDAAHVARRCTQAIEDATPPTVKQKLGQASEIFGALPAPVKYGVVGVTGAALLAGPLAPPILGGMYGIGAAGPVAGGAFAGIQASGAVVAGSSWAVVQSVAMGGALPFIGTFSAGAIGGAVGAASGAVVSLACGTNGTDAGAGSHDGGPGGDGQLSGEKDNLGDEESMETEKKKSQ